VLQETLIPALRLGLFQLLANDSTGGQTRAAGGFGEPSGELLSKTNCDCVTHIKEV